MGYHPEQKSAKTLLIHFVLCSCSNEAEENFFLISQSENHHYDSVLPPLGQIAHIKARVMHSC